MVYVWCMIKLADGHAEVQVILGSTLVGCVWRQFCGLGACLIFDWSPDVLRACVT